MPFTLDVRKSISNYTARNYERPFHTLLKTVSRTEDMRQFVYVPLGNDTFYTYLSILSVSNAT